MLDVTRSSDATGYAAQPPQDVLPAQDFCQLRRGFDAIFQWDDGCVGSEQGHDCLGSLGDLPRLYTHQDGIDRTDPGWIIAGVNRLELKITLDTFYAESICQHGLQVLTAGDEGHFFSRLRQPTAKITTRATRPKYCNVHNRLPTQGYMILH